MKDATHRRMIESAYRSVLASDATYTDESGTDTAVRVVYSEESALLTIANGSAREPGITMRVRASEVTQPQKGDVVVFCGHVYKVSGYERINRLEWSLYVTV